MKITIEGNAQSIATLLNALLFEDEGDVKDEETVREEILAEIVENLSRESGVCHEEIH